MAWDKVIFECASDCRRETQALEARRRLRRNQTRTRPADWHRTGLSRPVRTVPGGNAIRCRYTERALLRNLARTPPFACLGLRPEQ